MRFAAFCCVFVCVLRLALWGVLRAVAFWCVLRFVRFAETVIPRALRFVCFAISAFAVCVF